MDVHPLVFEPMYKPKIWGGRKLSAMLGKPLPEGIAVGEAWEVADLPNDESIVARGPARGRTLGDLVRTWGTALIGRAALVDGRFPLLIKFLDARETLSVQVHPDTEMAHRLGGDVRVKHEAWFVIHAADGGFIYRGLQPGVGPEDLRRAISDQRIESVLRRIPVRKGHFFYLPSGTVHALGAGVVVAEVQTPSDTTFRLYDWNRIDPSTGQTRPLHVEQALQCVAFESSRQETERRQHIATVWTAVTRLGACESFVIEQVRMVEGVQQRIPYAEMVIWMILQGRGNILYQGPGSPFSFELGDSVLIPADLREGCVQTLEDCVWLEVTIPIPSSLAAYDRPDAAHLADSPPPGNNYIPLTISGKPLPR